MLDFLRKEQVGEFMYTNAGTNRNFEKKVLVNGHRAVVTYAKPLAEMVGIMYKVWDPSVKSFKYVLNIGIGEQDVNDNIGFSMDALSEEASVNARISPVITVVSDDADSLAKQFESLCDNYLCSSQKTIRSLQEVHNEMNKCSYGRRYPYDWLYFGMHKRSELLSYGG